MRVAHHAGLPPPPELEGARGDHGGGPVAGRRGRRAGLPGPRRRGGERGPRRSREPEGDQGDDRRDEPDEDSKAETENAETETTETETTETEETETEQAEEETGEDRSPAAGEGLRKRGDIYAWPGDLRAFTVVLLSAEDRRSATAFARSASGAGKDKIGVIDSSKFSSLPSGFFVVFAGRVRRPWAGRPRRGAPRLPLPGRLRPAREEVAQPGDERSTGQCRPSTPAVALTKAPGSADRASPPEDRASIVAMAEAHIASRS